MSGGGRPVFRPWTFVCLFLAFALFDFTDQALAQYAGAPLPNKPQLGRLGERINSNTIAMVLELMRSPSVPSCGLFGSGAPLRCACACVANAANARKRQIDFHGRQAGFPSRPMICPRATDLRQRNTHRTRYAYPYLFDA